MMETYPGIDNTGMFAALRLCMTERVPHSMQNEFSYPNGDKGWFELSIEPAPEGIFILSVDITDRKRAEQSLLRANRSLQVISECNQALVHAADEKQLLDSVCRILVKKGGYPLVWIGFAGPEPDRTIRPAAWAGVDEGEISVLEFPRNENEDQPRPAHAALSKGQYQVFRNVAHSCHDCALMEFLKRHGIKRVISFPLMMGEKAIGAMNIYSAGSDPFLEDEIRLLAELTDDLAFGISDHRLRAAHDRLNRQLLQSQKMEAIGLLAGGVAHDFNNQLTVIMTYCESLLGKLPASQPGRGDVQEIMEAAQRSAELTRQLLAFSRKQVLQIQAMDLNLLVRNLEKMLGRLIGEDMQLASFQAPDLGLIFADPAQIEQVIINLAVNARDAMPGGGKLTIETRNVELDDNYAAAHSGVTAGPHVLLSVADTGLGLGPETLAHILEPFFTTKETRKGTGMGLAMVHGIIKQCGGDINVYSEPGHGTTFKIYFPRLSSRKQPQPAPPQVRKAAGGETVLVVEDEVPVRRIACRVLNQEGYRVLEARDVEDAVRISKDHSEQPIHLLLTDFIMPVMSGRELAEKLVRDRPEMKVLYMSGYTDDAIAHHGVLDPGLHFLPKPFTAFSLATKVREVLEGLP